MPAETHRYLPNNTVHAMFWEAMRTPLEGADSNVERFMLAVASCWIQPGDFVVDLGANHGQHARVFATRLEPEGRLLALEADPTLSDDLLRGAAESPVEIEVVNAAVSDHSAGTVTFFRHPTRDQEGSLYRRESVEYEEIAVPMISVDDLLAGHPDPRFVKIDVEGAEYAALRGARGLLGGTDPLIACEISFDRQIETPSSVEYSLRDLISLLAEDSWSLYLLDGTRVRLEDLDDPEFRIHYECWLARSGSAAERFVSDTLPQLVTAFAWGSSDAPPYPYHLDKYPVV